MRTSGPDSAPVQLRAVALVEELLGLDELAVAGLLDRSRAVLGGKRTEAALAVVRASRLTRRHDPLAGLAALVVGAPVVGEGWFSQPLPDTPADHCARFQREAESTPVTPDEILLDLLPWRSRPGPDRVRSVGYLIADAVAGPAVDFVDLNSPVAADSLRMPDDAKPGDTYAMSFDPGGLVDAVVIQHRDGMLGYELDMDTVRFSAPAEIDWAVGILWQNRVVLLPGELPGTASDPLAKAIGSDLAETAETLRVWARDHGLGEDAGRRWRTLSDLDHARRLVSPAARGADWIWSSAVAALLDGEVEEARTLANRLRG